MIQKKEKKAMVGKWWRFNKTSRLLAFGIGVSDKLKYSLNRNAEFLLLYD